MSECFSNFFAVDDEIIDDEITTKEIEKGCGEVIYLNKLMVKCCGGSEGLCSNCQKLLSQNKEFLKIVDKVLLRLANTLHPSNQDYDWYKIIYKELKKEVKK